MAQMTVGMPAYKTTFLVQAIASVLEQTFTDFELLISDDSPDGSVSDIVRRFRDPRIRLVQGPRAGLAANCAHVWDNAATDLLKFLCDDDLLFPTALADLLGVLRKNQDYVFAFGRRSIIDRYGRVLRKPLGFLGDNWVWFEPTALANNLVHEIDNDLAELSSLLIRRSVFQDATCLTRYAGLPIRRLVDVAFMMNAAERGPSVATCQLVASVRDHPNRISARADAPDISAGLFEWEIFLRGGVQRGVVTADRALLGLPNLQRLYRRRGRGLGEIVQLQKGLPELEDRLAKGQSDLVTDRFRSDLEIADYMINGRLAAAGSQPPAEAAEAEESSQFHGKIEHISRDHARGWAWAPEAGDRTVQVVAMIGDRVIGHALANQDRRDLADWNIGSGQYGFDMTFYEPLLTDATPTFRLFLDAEDWQPESFKLAPLDRTAISTGDSARAALREHSKFTERGPQFEEFSWTELAGIPQMPAGLAPLVVAFYLPQFYATPENNRFWGKGFTEWRQLPRGVPRFPGHYQPRIPRDLGFYNLLDVDVIARQAAMAKAAGIGAFAYYYYWFDKQRVLERPVELLLNSDIDMPFFIIWANENWTRQWDGSEQEVLLKQDYRLEDEDALLADLARHMLDPRYVRLEGRPLFVIYNPEPIPDIRNTIARWRETWAARFGLKPLIFMAQTFSRLDPRPYGLDGALEFPPHKLGQYAPRRDVLDAFSRDFAGQVIQYDDFVRTSVSEPASGYPLVKTVVPSWDNEARRPNRGVILEGSSPQKYQDWLQTLVESAIDNPVFGTPLVAINAWNEWAEGAYLEPDIHFGSSYLNATARAVKGAIQRKHLELSRSGAERRKPSGRGGKVRVFLHVGLHKTGTTSIQGALTTLRAELAGRGVLYPKTGRPEWADLGQHLLPWSVARDQDALPTVHGHRARFGDGDADALWEALRQEIARSGAGAVIISSEEFDTLDRSEIEDIGHRLSAYDVTPVLFLRRSSRLLESNYRTSVIYSQYAGDIRQFRQDHRNRVDMYDLVNDWRSIAAGREAILLDYEQPEVQRDVIGAFMTALDLGDMAGGAHARLHLNKSTPAFICEAVRFMRQSRIPEDQISQWLDETGRLQIPTQASRAYTCMLPELEAELDAQYAAELKRMMGDPEVAAMARGAFRTAFDPSKATVIEEPATAMLMLARELGKGAQLSAR